MLETLTGTVGLALLEFIPESFAVFAFGGGLILLAISLRKLFSKTDAGKQSEIEDTIG